ncbi:kinetochore complex Sim4 subunit Fta1-domain-containing protein [Hypoxylon sp. NC1633]|nr:kinetochore complex Sim4 subunit Fta1-domain-containing protein [Hypoxylon sp. NC1633]
MPPRKPKPLSPSPVVDPPSPPSEAPSSAPPSADMSHSDVEAPRFFNTTFTTYRASPLHIGKQPLSSARLQLLSRRLRDALVGDVVRGVQVGLESNADAALGRTGSLLVVDWRWVDSARIIGCGNGEDGRSQASIELGNDSDDHSGKTDDQTRREARRTMCIELRYENARFGALLLPNLGEDDGTLGAGYHQPLWTWQENHDNPQMGEMESAFMHLPLLLFRMPAPLKSVLVDFLSNAFDCRISPLALGTRSLVGSWESWLSDSRQPLSKDVLFTLGFHIEPPEPKSPGVEHGDEPDEKTGEADQNEKSEPFYLGLKSIDVAIPAREVRRFLRIGKVLDSDPNSDSDPTITRKRKAGAATTLSDSQKNRRRRRLAGGRDEEGWAWRNQNHNLHDEVNAEDPEPANQPFTEALATYLWHHMGLDMFHPGVRVQRVACDAFALSEGRLKVFPPSRGSYSYNEEAQAAVWKLMKGLVRRAQGRMVMQDQE